MQCFIKIVKKQYFSSIEKISETNQKVSQLISVKKFMGLQNQFRIVGKDVDFCIYVNVIDKTNHDDQ